MFLFFRSKTVGKTKLIKPDSPGSSAQLGRAALKTACVIRIYAEHPAGRRYETTSENDNNLNYDKLFKPATLFCLP
jgi:hypothetical protein